MFAQINGTKIYFDVEGSGYVPEGPKMVKKDVLFAIHGGPGSDHSDLKPWLTPLSEHVQIVYMDQRCNGQSERVDPAICTFEQLADDIEALKNYLGLEKIHILGHSFGGMVAQHYAVKYASSILKLFLICTAPSKEFYKDALEFAKKVATPEQVALIPEFFEGHIRDEEHAIAWWDAMFELYFYNKDPQIMFETGNRPIGSQEVANYTFKYLMPQYDVRNQIKNIKIPTLVVSGRHDWITPVTQGEVIHQLIDKSTFIVYEQSGHMPFIEEHQKFIADVSHFLLQEV